MSGANRIILITIVAFAAYYFIDDLFFRNLYEYLTDLTGLQTAAFFLAYVLVGIPLLIGLLIMHRKRGVFSSLGINKGFARGMGFSLLCTLPMLLGYAAVFEFNQEITWHKILTGAAAAALFEELYFRGVLFGQIYRFTRVGFIPSIIIGAILFALVHLYQSDDVATLIGIFISTFIGAFLFAWAYVEWGNNLWVPIGLHLFMNLFWMLFSAGDNAFGGPYANIFRGLTIVAIIVGTIFYKRKKGLQMEVNRKTIWMK